MAPPGFDDVSLFDESQISSSVTSDQALKFFETYGIFYQEHSKIGGDADMTRGRQITVGNMAPFRAIIMDDPRLAAVLAPFIEREPSLAFTLGPDEGNFYSLAKEEDTGQLVVVYMWRPKAKLEFSHGSQIGPTVGVTASNGLVHRPYKHLSDTKGLQDIKINLEEGGILIVHPRLAFQVKSSVAVGFVCEKSAKAV